jgi:ABC-type transport system substrate-binding protein
LNLLAGKLDGGPIPKDNFAAAIDKDGKLKPELAAKGMFVKRTPMLDITHLSFNFADPIVGKNKLLRQALSLAYDQKTFNDLFYNGRAIEAQGPIPPGLAGYDPNFKNPYRTHDLVKAKELLAKAGYPGGKGLPPLELAALSDSTSRQETEFLQKCFGDIGVQVHVNTYSWPEFNASIKNKRGQIWEFAWGADYPDAENFLQLFYSKNASPGSNDSNYNNPEFDKLYEKSLTMPDSPERTAVYKQAVAVLVEDCPWIWGATRESWGLYNKWFKNAKYHEVDHTKFKYWRVDANLKK